MARIPTSNPRYRSRDRLCRDIAHILISDFHYGTKHAVLSEATWVWTEFEGKYDGCEHWSKAAAQYRGQRGHEKLLVHEHIVPKSIVIKRLVDLIDPTEESVRHVLEQYCKAAVITREEDASLNRLGLRSKMPKDWDEKDPWSRYKAAGIILS